MNTRKNKQAMSIVLSAFVLTLSAFQLTLPVVTLAADTSLQSPTTAGNPNTWTNPGNAFASDDTYATNSTEEQEQGYASFNFPSIPSGSVINGIEVKIEAKSSDANGCRLETRLSWNNDLSNTAVKFASITGNDSVVTLGGSVNTWGRTWAVGDFVNSNFVLRVAFDDVSGNSCRQQDVPNNSALVASIDHMQAQVFYTPPVVPEPNPALPNSCGLDIALVMDSSGSINESELGTMKNALTEFVNAFLPGTPTEFSVIDFDNTATVTQTFTSNGTDIVAAIAAPSSGGFTNWEDALIKADSTFDPRQDHPNLVVFASDGNPNRKGNNISVSEPEAVNAAMVIANSLKTSGTKIIALGIGDQLDVPNLEKISSPADVYTSNFDTLAADLADIATQMCGGTITVTKFIDADGNLETNDQSPDAGWIFTINNSDYTSDETGKTPAVEVDTSTYTVTENLQDGYDLLSASCTGATSNGSFLENSITGIEVGTNDIVSCTFINHKNEKPTITLTGPDPLNLLLDVIFQEPGFSASDLEDGDITADMLVTGTVDTSTIGAYVLHYNVTDSDGNAAEEKTRTVNVSEPPSQCADGVDNEGDGAMDFGGENPDSGCSSLEDDDENSQPVIEMIGLSLVSTTLGETYTDAGATANDEEDGDGLPVTDVTSDVDTNTPGTYHVHYNFTDSDGAAAAEVIRTVEVKPACSDGIDNDADEHIDFGSDQGCADENENSENATPSITLNGPATVNILVGDSYTEEGAVAHDEEDGDNPAFVSGTVDTATSGDYVTHYTYTDSDGAIAPEVTRTVHISPKPACSDGQDNDEDGKIDALDPACHTDGNPDNTGSYDPNDADESNDPEPPTACADTLDNDQDGKTDLDDPGCQNAEDTDESNPPENTGGGGGGGSGGESGGSNSDAPPLVIMANGPLRHVEGPQSGSPQVLGTSTSTPQPAGQVLGESCSELINSYIKLGKKNDPVEVRKLQEFLNKTIGTNLPITGFYEELTWNAVNTFQVTYGTEVLTPWIPYGHPDEKTPTGYVYKTTKRWINMLHCPGLNIPMPQLP